VKGCEVIGTDLDEIDKAREAAAASEAAIVVVGENEWQAEDGKATSGEGFDAATLELTGLQEDLIRAVAGTGTPTIVVLINGRPLAVRFAAERVPAVIEAWVCGEKGGRAVAEIVFGDRNPSGKLPLTVPRHAGQLPAYYNAKKSKAYWLKEGWGRSYADLDPTPLYPFGHGLSYTTYAYRDLRLSRQRIGPADSIEIRFDIENTGDRPGQEVAQLYVQDVTSSVSTPIMELKGFARVVLEPAEVKTVRLVLTPAELALFDRWLDRLVEPGQFKVFVGSSSEDIRLQAAFTVEER
jgi:beta-glucosidase